MKVAHKIKETDEQRKTRQAAEFEYKLYQIRTAQVSAAEAIVIQGLRDKGL